MKIRDTRYYGTKVTLERIDCDPSWKNEPPVFRATAYDPQDKRLLLEIVESKSLAKTIYYMRAVCRARRDNGC